MKIVVVQHVPYIGPGVIRSWVESHGHELISVASYDGEEAPLDGDLTVFFGEGGSVIDKMIFEGKKVLGIGLGAQAIGEVLGAPPEMRDRKSVV